MGQRKIKAARIDPLDAGVEQDSRGQSIWLEIAGVTMQTGGDEAGLKVRFAGDRGDKQQNWWPVAIGDDGEVARSETYRRILDALDHKRQVLGELAPDDGELKCRALRTGSGDRSL